jgi:hypothetical protein
MSRTELLTRLQDILDEAEREHTFGSVELEIRNGTTVLIRRTITEKTSESKDDNRHAYQNRN